MIYFIKAENVGIKIGKTELEAETRLASMQTSCPLELTLLGTVAGEGKREQELHERFDKARIRGEWFCMDIKAEIESIINEESCLEGRQLHSINRAISKAKDTNVINGLVYIKEKLLKKTIG